MATKKSATQIEVEKVEQEVSEALKLLNADAKRTRQGIAEQKAKLVMAVKAAKVIEPLMKLKSGKAVEKFLRDRNVRGIVANPKRCPIAQYLRAKGPKGAGIDVDWHDLALDGISVKATAAISDFILRFDGGHIPDLNIRKRKPKAKKKV